MGPTKLNLKVFRWINGWPEAAAPFWRFFSEAVNQLWFKIAILVLLVSMVAAGKGPRMTALLALISVGLANFCTDLWKNFMPDPRPFNEIGDVLMRAGRTPHAGTASAHAANMMAVATVFLVRSKWWGAPWLVAAILTGISRIYVGVHYPYQVLLGWGTGATVAGLVLWVQFLINRSRLRVGLPKPT